MPKFKIEVPITMFLIVEVEADDAEAALESDINVPKLCLQCGPKFSSFSKDNVNWDKAVVLGEVKG